MRFQLDSIFVFLSLFLLLPSRQLMKSENIQLFVSTSIITSASCLWIPKTIFTPKTEELLQESKELLQESVKGLKVADEGIASLLVKEPSVAEPSVASNHEPITKGPLEKIKENISDLSSGLMNALDQVIASVKNTLQRLQKGLSQRIDATKSKIKDTNDLYKLFKQALENQKNPPTPPTRPDGIRGSLLKKWDARPKPIKEMGARTEKRIMDTRSDYLLTETAFKNLPSFVKKKIKTLMVDNAPMLFDALCKGKIHENPRIQELARSIEDRLTRENTFISKLVLRGICIAKKSPLRKRSLN